MPFRSKAQWKMAFAKKAKWAREWAHKTRSYKALPSKVGRGKKRKK